MIRYHDELTQGSDEWKAARCGLLTASEMKLIITPTLKVADNDKSRSHLYEILAQRITGYVEPNYISDDMLRGKEDELDALIAYNANYEPVRQVGFITSDDHGFTLGYSPDGLVGDDGCIEVKSRRQKFQIETIISGEMPSDYSIQVQTGLLVTGRKWCDFVSYSGGMFMTTIRIEANPLIQEAIFSAAAAFEAKLAEKLAIYNERIKSGARLIPTERKVEQEIVI